jgi:hypothetical protein
MKLQNFLNNLFEPISSKGLAVFRTLFGFVMLWEVWRYFDKGWIERYWVEPVFNFKYEFFEWVEPLSADGMTLLFYVMGILALFVAIGFLYRVSITLLFLIFTYTFLLEQARYLNHFYLVILINFLLILLPAQRALSVDAWLFPGIRSEWVPRWSVLILQFQIGIVYFFGGIAKLNRDWLSGSPMDSWLPARSDFPIIGQYFDIPDVILFVSYSALFLDLLAFPLLMWRKSRPWMMIALVAFHLMNDRLFTIGIFPWFMIGALVIYLPSSWPQDFYRYLSTRLLSQKLLLIAAGLTGAYIGTWFHEGLSILPFLVAFGITVIIIWDILKLSRKNDQRFPYQGQHQLKPWIIVGLSFWILFQTLLPLRHIVIPGNPSWTEEGHRFAWHMKLRSKSCEETFYIRNESTGEMVGINGMPFLESWQQSKVTSRPQLVIQYAQYLSDLHNNAPVYSDIKCSLNGNPPRTLIKPNVDLTNVTFRDWQANDWIER